MTDIIEADTGQHLDDFAKELRLIARARREEVYGRHNGRILYVKPKSSIHDIVSQWASLAGTQNAVQELARPRLCEACGVALTDADTAPCTTPECDVR